MIERFKKWLRETVSSLVTLPPVIEGKPAMRITATALAEANASFGGAHSPFEIKPPPPWLDASMAMDTVNPSLTEIYNYAVNGTLSEGLAFLGFPYLSELSQRPEYRRATEIYASEATRKWIKINSTDEDRKAKIEKALKRFKIKERFREAVEQDGFFGRSQIFVDLGHRLNDEELTKKLPLTPAKIGKGSVKNFKVVEPFWSYPGTYDSTNPLAADYYVPRYWNVFSAQVHASRLLTFVSREVPDILKPTYQFSGLSRSQLVKPYVDNWIRTRQSVSDLLHSFSTMVLATDLSTVLGGGGAEALVSRAQLFNKTRDNRGLMMVNKDSEELTNVSTPLSELAELQSQAQELLASVAAIPLVIWLGSSPSGLNASSDGEVRTFYDAVKAFQERLLREPLQKVIEIVQLDLDGRIDEDLTFEFIDLWETPEVEKATIRKTNAEIDVAYVNSGVVDNEEVRERLSEDEESPYYGVNLAGPAPDMPGGYDDEEEDEGPEGTAQDTWNESDHPRDERGRFGSGGGNIDYSHLNALEESLFREEQRLRAAKTEKERAFREVQVSQKKKEIAGERKFLGLPEEAPEPDLDDDDLLAALGQDRAIFPETGTEPRAAGVLMIDGDGRVLLLKRSITAVDHQETWCFPGGGIEDGETPLAAARRETIEETGHDPGEKLAGPICFHEGFMTYMSTTPDAFAPILNDEHSAYVWARPEEAPQPLHPGVATVFKAWGVDCSTVAE